MHIADNCGKPLIVEYWREVARSMALGLSAYFGIDIVSVDCEEDNRFQNHDRACCDSAELSTGNLSFTKMSALTASNGKYSGLGKPAIEISEMSEN